MFKRLAWFALNKKFNNQVSMLEGEPARKKRNLNLGT